MARNEPTTWAPVPRFMPIPRLSSLARGMEAILRAEKTLPPLAMMAAWDSALPSEGFDSGFQPIEASRRKPGAEVSVPWRVTLARQRVLEREREGGRIGLTLSPSEVAGVILDALLLGSSCETHFDLSL